MPRIPTQKNPRWLRPRHRNPIIKMIEEEYIPINPDTRKPETDPDKDWRLEAFQVRLLNRAFLEVWQPSKRIKIPEWNTFIWSQPKKSGKTAMAGAVGYAWARHYGGEILFVANDKEQARDRAFNRVTMMFNWLRANRKSQYDSMVESQTNDALELKDPYALLRAIPCDPGGEAGGFQSLTIWDELWNYKGDNANALWSELQPIPNIPVSARFVVTYAGHYGKADLLYSIYEQAVQPDPENDDQPQGQRVAGLEDLPCFDYGNMFCYWDHDARMPWHTEEFLEQARNDPVMKTQPHEYERLWRNRWTTGLNAFIDMNKVDKLMRQGDAMGLYNRMDAFLGEEL